MIRLSEEVLSRQNPPRKSGRTLDREAEELNQPKTQQSLGRMTPGGRRWIQTPNEPDKKRTDMDIRRFAFRQKIKRHTDPGFGDKLTRDDDEISFFPDTDNTSAALDRAMAMARATATAGSRHGTRRLQHRGRARSKNKKADKQCGQSVF
jgi:hypothetical protein